MGGASNSKLSNSTAFGSRPEGAVRLLRKARSISLDSREDIEEELKMTAPFLELLK